MYHRRCISSYPRAFVAEPDFMVSGHHTYREHSSVITHAKFSKSGNTIASADVDHVIK